MCKHTTKAKSTPRRTITPRFYVFNFSDVTVEVLELSYKIGKEIEIDYDNQVVYIQK